MRDLSPETHVLIAGPTASGKSALALEIAADQGGVIVNADAIQVFANWRVLTARPSIEDEKHAPHALYGHIAGDAPYSVGHWLREVNALLQAGQRLIITGGTGLYFQALTAGLAEIPATPADIRKLADSRVRDEGFEALLQAIDADTRARIDVLNPMRVQRAWEVQQATGRGLASWQDATPAPILPVQDSFPVVFDTDKDWLNERIARRFQMMIEGGAMQEAERNFESWSPDHLSSKAIGAPELMAHLKGEVDLETAIDRATIATRQFAKRQRTWFRSKMKEWRPVSPS